MTTIPRWYEIYKVALLETDWSRMEERIQAAEAAIRERKREFDLNHGGSLDENRAIVDAITASMFSRPKRLSGRSEKKRTRVSGPGCGQLEVIPLVH